MASMSRLLTLTATLLACLTAAVDMNIYVYTVSTCTGIIITTQGVNYGSCVAGTDGKSSAKFSYKNSTVVTSLAYDGTVCAGTPTASGDVPFGLCFTTSGVYLKFEVVTTAPGPTVGATTTAAPRGNSTATQVGTKAMTVATALASLLAFFL